MSVIVHKQASYFVLIRCLLQNFVGIWLHLGEEVFWEPLNLMEDVIVAAPSQAAEVGQGDDTGGEPLGAEPQQAGSVHQELGARSCCVDGCVAIKGSHK